MAIYLPPKCWTGRVDGQTEDVKRWHQIMQQINLDEANGLTNKHPFKIALIGFCCDEGVRRNQGRQGAFNGPNAIRSAAANFPVHFEKLQLSDAGNVCCPDDDLEAAQLLLGNKIEMLIRHKYFPIVLGGGHEVAFGNFIGLQDLIKKKTSFGVINVDAHFDLREVEKAVGATSGTGFWQMAMYCKQQETEYRNLTIGIQDCSNTKRLFDTAHSLGALYVKAEELTNDQLEGILDQLNYVLEESDMVQLSIDLDVFNAASAPGVSAPAFNGIQPNSMFKRILRHIIFSKKLVSIDIAELNPTFDLDNRTAKLAASFIFEIVLALERN